MVEQKIKQDICIGANIRRIRKENGVKQTELVRLLQLNGIEMTRESLVKIERGAQHIQASQGLSEHDEGWLLPYPYCFQ